MPTDLPSGTDDAYERAWGTLGMRLAYGTKPLVTAMAAGPDRVLMARYEALSRAGRLHRDLDPAENPGSDYQTAWRAYERRLAELLRVEPNPHCREALLLVNTYQRGFGDAIDARELTA